MKIAKIIVAIVGLIVSLTMTACQSYYNRQMMREWDALNDTIEDCSRKIQNIVNAMQLQENTSLATQQTLLHELDSISEHMKQTIRNCAERNKDNELGKYIRENYTEE